ncbi:putative copia-type protein, partial [Trifolium pratense]
SESATLSCDASLYRSIIGSLHYLSITRPDVAFAVNKLSQHMQAPTANNMQALKRVMRYLKHTISHGLNLVRTTTLHLTAFCDADWGGDTTDRKSTGAYIVYFGPNAISWSCKKQSTVARSSTEAEYRTIGSTTTELLWLQQLLSELGIRISEPPTIFTYNIGANYLCVNPVFHTRMKHLAIDYHFVRDLVAKKELQVSHVPSSHQLADLLTKPLSRTRHQFLTSKIGVVEPSSILRGRKGAISSS